MIICPYYNTSVTQTKDACNLILAENSSARRAEEFSYYRMIQIRPLQPSLMTRSSVSRSLRRASDGI